MDIKEHKINNLEITLEQFKDYFLEHDYDENMFNEDGTLNPKYNSFKKTGTIAEILEDWWPKISKEEKDIILKYRTNAEEEIKKVIDCYNKNLGCSLYECPNCHDYIFIGHTCKSRFCTSCGYKYKLDIVNNILSTAYNCKHRQIVFTIPKELRAYFFYDYENMINLLFKAVNSTIYSILNDNFKKKKNGKIKKYKSKIIFTPGFFTFLHTFGRDLKWNPHIHVLIAEIKMGGDMIYKKWNYFNFDALSKRFQKILLDLMREKLGPSFESIKNKSYLNHKNGFYVFAEDKKFTSFKNGIEYVARYCGRPAISENRIINYDGNNVTFCYNDHIDNSYHEVTVTAINFIQILLRHLIPHNFKSIRYCGFYKKKHKNHDKMIMMINPMKKEIKKQFNTFRMRILNFFNRDPFRCSKCDTLMIYSCEIIKGG